MYIFRLSIHSCFFFIFCLVYTTRIKMPLKMEISNKQRKKNKDIRQGEGSRSSFGLSHETSYFFVIVWRGFFFQCRSYNFFLFGSHLFKLTHHHPWTKLRICVCYCLKQKVRKTWESYSKTRISKLRKCVHCVPLNNWIKQLFIPIQKVSDSDMVFQAEFHIWCSRANFVTKDRIIHCLW